MEVLSSFMSNLLGEPTSRPLQQSVAINTDNFDGAADSESPASTDHRRQPRPQTDSKATGMTALSDTSTGKADQRPAMAEAASPGHVSSDVARLHAEREELQQQLADAATLMGGVRQQLGTR